MKIPVAGLASYFKGELIFLSESTVSFWNLESQKCIRTINLIGKLELNYCQMIALEEDLFIIDLKNNRFFYLNADELFSEITIPKINSIGFFCAAHKNQNEIFFLCGLEFNLFHKINLSYENVSGISIRKSLPYFRDIATELFCYSHSILDFSKNCEKILYHKHGGVEENRIGIYDSKQKASIAEFDLPQGFDVVDWSTGITLDNYLKAYKSIQGCLLEYKIVVCFDKELYVMDSSGNIIRHEVLPYNRRYAGVCKMNDNCFLATILDISDNSETEIVAFN